MRLVYTVLAWSVFLAGLPFFLLASAFRPALLRGFGERLGRVPGPLRSDDRPAIWVHAVSLGEIRAVKPLLPRLRAQHVRHRIVLTTTTPAGRAFAKSAGLDLDGICFLPLDLPPFPSRTVRGLRPDLFIALETEIWPNLLGALRQQGVPALILNGRVSPRSFRRTRRLRFFFKGTLRGVTFAGMQTWEDAERLAWMGMPVTKMEVTGNLKFDADFAREPSPSPGLGALLEGCDGRPLWVAGSTAPGEEELLLDAVTTLRKRFPHLILLLAPRRPERFEEVASLLERRGVPFRRRSRPGGDTVPEVILLDSLGELVEIYRKADVVFVGGSLVPGGGHSMLEPAALGKPVLWGPHVENFRDAARRIAEGGGGFPVSGTGELVARVEALLADPEARERAGRAARETIEKNRGAVERSLAIVNHYLLPDAPPPRKLLPVG